MEEKDCSQDKLLKSFYEELDNYSRASYLNSLNYYKGSEFAHFIGEEQTPFFLILTKSVFQHIYSFLYFVKDDIMIFPAFNGLRSAIEGIRLIRALMVDSNFRDEYINNDNWNFDSVPDYKFMQQKVNKVLEASEQELRSLDNVPISYILFNHTFTKESALSRAHSELSKWSHMLNSNMIRSLMSNGKIYLGLTNDLESEELSSIYIRKYLEVLYLAISGFNQSFPVTDELYEISIIINEIYSEYIEIYYKISD